MVTPTTVGWRGTSDHNVTETAFDAVKCKLSAVTLGYFQDPFLRFFVEKPTRRIPLIHRGYYLRHVAITRCVELFLSQYTTSAEVNIVSLGAGFDTLFFRLLEQRQFAGKISFAEVDCDAIVSAKTKLLSDEDVRAGLFPKDAENLSVVATADGKVAWQCRVPSATYSLISCDLGDKERLDATLHAAGVDRSLPTLVQAECVVSYLAPEKGTMLLRWVAEAFPNSSIALYDPIGLQASEEGDDKNATDSDKEETGAFGSTLQRYFAVKGCTLRGARGFRTAADHARRLLALAHWKRCRILDMNGVFAACTTAEEKRRLATLEPFDEFVDWMLCNSHYAIYLADNCKDQDKDGLQWTSRFVPRAQQHRYLLTASTMQQQKQREVVMIRSFQDGDLAPVRSLFESTHLEFAKGSRAVRQFVANRLRGPSGDMFDVHQAFQAPNSAGVATSGFWVAEVGGEVVGCVGVKPLSGGEGLQTAELCRLSVSPAIRRRGVASALVRTVEAFAASCGSFKEIRLETIGAMEGAQQLYRALGYIEQTEKGMQETAQTTDNGMKQVSAALEKQYTASLAQSNGATLDLSSLGLAELPSLDELAQRFPRLNQLNIRRNALRFLPDGLARAFPQLRLNVAHNRLRELPVSTFERLDALEELDARANLIEKISFDNLDEKLPVGAGLRKLQVLLLADNRLRAIDPTTTDMLPKLRVIDLSGNSELMEAPEKLRRLHERNLLLHSRAKRRELITRALSIRKAVAQALATAPPASPTRIK
ncbi:hypothetical protein PF007_g3206 [Phytophthora fragariae]|uniref:[phosphatase 2A protein]-leucine-carboxy methyltransferase n=2 Tax=Phytophthora fragariae TaxID=53985 RepID=A0A6A3TBY4_9STRA|nr:hypothetical protein PF007_g3206 [Phytophthora fragariae]KAE9251016.1 hypothetical protein PF004_g2681 [Phytophthora fragariae]